MGMDMDMAIIPTRVNHRWPLFFILLLVTTRSLAADVEFHPTIGGGFTYSDNINRDSQDEIGSLISKIDAGVATNIKGADGAVEFDYTLSQLFYSHESDNNETYQALTFTADKGINRSGFRLDANASIDNIARAADQNASADVISGDTIENKHANIGLNYHSNPRSKVDFSARAYTDVTNNEDDIGNYNGYGAEFNFANGATIKEFFWLIEGSYDVKDGKNSNADTSFTILREEFGLQTLSGWVPFLRLNYEDYEGSSDADSTDTFSWGPALRYFWTKQSYLELSYNFSEDDNNPDFWAGAINIIPSPRTRLFASYDKRFFGDAYELLLSHRSRRLTNSITYTEEAVSFDRDFFTSGTTIEEISLNRRLEWSSVLAARRTDYELSIYRDEREALNPSTENQNDEVNGIGIAVHHRLARRLTVSGRFDYDYYQFVRRSSNDQNDYYRAYELEGQYQLNRYLSTSLGLSHNNKSSSLNTNNYDETRLFVDIRMQL